ncbi:MAG: hypothetical protein ACI9BD_000264 [Candidatus Marinamargulisbacteria bacterium]|jgi:hypothetical protein
MTFGISQIDDVFFEKSKSRFISKKKKLRQSDNFFDHLGERLGIQEPDIQIQANMDVMHTLLPSDIQVIDL